MRKHTYLDCFKFAYIVELFQKYGFEPAAQQVTFKGTINDNKVNWAIGALLFHIGMAEASLLNHQNAALVEQVEAASSGGGIDILTVVIVGAVCLLVGGIWVYFSMFSKLNCCCRDKSDDFAIAEPGFGLNKL